MIFEWISALGSWSWIVFGLILLVLEVALPSVFFLWFGIAALVVGLITLMLGVDSAIWPWQVQWITFAILSLVSLILGRNYMKQREKSDPADMLNKRSEQWIGTTVTLLDATSNTRSRVKLGDTTWNVKIKDNQDLPKGAKVTIVEVDASLLIAESV
jgi:membrane protein implicated in regulation of membrane protease activity